MHRGRLGTLRHVQFVTEICHKRGNQSGAVQAISVCAILEVGHQWVLHHCKHAHLYPVLPGLTVS